MKKITFLLLMFSLSFADSVQAWLVLDQAHEPIGGFAAFTVANDRSQIQTFTVGRSGYLSQVDVKVSKSTETHEKIDLSIWSITSQGQLITKLSSSSLAPSVLSIPHYREFIPFNFYANSLWVTEDDLLGIVLNSDATNLPPLFSERYVWEIGGQYNKGIAYTELNLNQAKLLASEDFLFRTYVSNTRLPTPSDTPKLPNSSTVPIAPTSPKAPKLPNSPNSLFAPTAPDSPFAPNAPSGYVAQIGDNDVPTTVNPEPATLLLFGIGMAGAMLRRRKQV